MRQIIYYFGGSTTTGVALAQTVDAGSAMVLNPSTFDYSQIAQSQVVFDSIYADQRREPGYTQRSVSLTSTGNIASVDFTFVGKNLQGTTVSQTISGPNNNTVYTSAIFSIVQSVTPSTGFSTQVSAGKGPDGVTKMFAPSQNGWYFGMGAAVMVTGAVVYTMQHTFQDIFNSSYPELQWFNNDDTNLVNATTSQDTNYAFNVGAVQVAKTDTGTGSLIVIFRQAGF